MKYLMYFLLLVLLLSTSCNRVKKGAKETINKSGELVGKTATEFAEGVTEGVDRALDCQTVLSQTLQEQGVRTGTFKIDDNPEGGHDNMLTLYTIFDEPFIGDVQVTVFTKKGLEAGRVHQSIEATKGETRYLSFGFDPKMQIETKSRFEIEQISND